MAAMSKEAEGHKAKTMDNDAEPFDVKVARKQTTYRSLAFQDSFRGFLDGSEFMNQQWGTAASSDQTRQTAIEDPVVFAPDDESQKIEIAMQNAMNMALQCSLPAIGSYVPFDAVDPNTWNKKSKKKKKREAGDSRRHSAPLVSDYIQEEYAGQGQAVTPEADTKARQKQGRRSSAPMSTSRSCEHMESTFQGEQVCPTIKGDAKKERRVGHCSRSPTNSSRDKKERRFRRRPSATAGASCVAEQLEPAGQGVDTTGLEHMLRHRASGAIIAPRLFSDTENHKFELENEWNVDMKKRDRQRTPRHSDSATRTYNKAEIERGCYSHHLSSSSASVQLLEQQEKMLEELLNETARKLAEICPEAARQSRRLTGPAVTPYALKQMETRGQEHSLAEMENIKVSHSSPDFNDLMTEIKTREPGAVVTKSGNRFWRLPRRRSCEV